MALNVSTTTPLDEHRKAERGCRAVLEELEPDVLRGELCRGNAGPDDHGHQEGGAEELGEQAARQGRCLNVGHTRMLTQPQWLSQT